MNKVADVMQTIFAVGIIICLFAGALSLLGYIVAIFIGGEIATSMCAWIFKTYLPWVIRIMSIIALVGLVTMYMKKQKALTIFAEKREEKNA